MAVMSVMQLVLTVVLMSMVVAEESVDTTQLCTPTTFKDGDNITVPVTVWDHLLVRMTSSDTVAGFIFATPKNDAENFLFMVGGGTRDSHAIEPEQNWETQKNRKRLATVPKRMKRQESPNHFAILMKQEKNDNYYDIKFKTFANGVDRTKLEGHETDKHIKAEIYEKTPHFRVRDRDAKTVITAVVVNAPRCMQPLLVVDGEISMCQLIAQCAGNKEATVKIVGQALGECQVVKAPGYYDLGPDSMKCIRDEIAKKESDEEEIEELETDDDVKPDETTKPDEKPEPEENPKPVEGVETTEPVPDEGTVTTSPGDDTSRTSPVDISSSAVPDAVGTTPNVEIVHAKSTTPDTQSNTTVSSNETTTSGQSETTTESRLPIGAIIGGAIGGILILALLAVGIICLVKGNSTGEPIGDESAMESKEDSAAKEGDEPKDESAPAENSAPADNAAAAEEPQKA